MWETSQSWITCVRATHSHFALPSQRRSFLNLWTCCQHEMTQYVKGILSNLDWNVATHLLMDKYRQGCLQPTGIIAAYKPNNSPAHSEMSCHTLTLGTFSCVQNKSVIVPEMECGGHSHLYCSTAPNQRFTESFQRETKEGNEETQKATATLHPIYQSLTSVRARRCFVS